jgi:hypothetical protein
VVPVINNWRIGQPSRGEVILLSVCETVQQPGWGGLVGRPTAVRQATSRPYGKFTGTDAARRA